MATTLFSPFELTKYRIAASIDPAILPMIHPEHFSTGLKDREILRMLGMPIQGEEEGRKESEREEISGSELSSTHPLPLSVPQHSQSTCSIKSRPVAVSSSDVFVTGGYEPPAVAEDVKGRRDRKKRDFYDASNYEPPRGGSRKKLERHETQGEVNDTRPSRPVEVRRGKWSDPETKLIQKHIEKKVDSGMSMNQYTETVAVLDFPDRTVRAVQCRMERQATESGLSLKNRRAGGTSEARTGSEGSGSRNGGQDGDHEDDASSEGSSSSSSDESD